MSYGIFSSSLYCSVPRLLATSTERDYPPCFYQRGQPTQNTTQTHSRKTQLHQISTFLGKPRFDILCFLYKCQNWLKLTQCNCNFFYQIPHRYVKYEVTSRAFEIWRDLRKSYFRRCPVVPFVPPSRWLGRRPTCSLKNRRIQWEFNGAFDIRKAWTNAKSLSPGHLWSMLAWRCDGHELYMNQTHTEKQRGEFLILFKYCIDTWTQLQLGQNDCHIQDRNFKVIS